MWTNLFNLWHFKMTLLTQQNHFSVWYKKEKKSSERLPERQLTHLLVVQMLKTVRLVSSERASPVPHLVPPDLVMTISSVWAAVKWNVLRWVGASELSSWEDQHLVYLKSALSCALWQLTRVDGMLCNPWGPVLGNHCGFSVMLNDVLSGISGPAHAHFCLDMCYFYSFVYWLLLRVQLSNRKYIGAKGLLGIRNPRNLWLLDKHLTCIKSEIVWIILQL